MLRQSALKAFFLFFVFYLGLHGETSSLADLTEQVQTTTVSKKLDKEGRLINDGEEAHPSKEIHCELLLQPARARKKKRATMNKDVLGSLFCLLFGIFFTVESFRFGMGVWSRPGPGYFPFGAGVLFSLISLFVLIKAIRKTGSGESTTQSADRFHLKNILLIVTGMLVYALLLKKIGFALCTFGLVIFFIHVIARKGWVNSIMTGLIVAIVFHVFFNMLLNAQLPNGLLGFVLG